MKSNLLLFLLLYLTGNLTAALPPRSQENLEERSALTITATVIEAEVAEEEGRASTDFIYTLQAKVDNIKKGDGVKVGDTITIRCWRMGNRPNGWAGPAGHFDIPSKGAQAKFWLRDRGEGTWEPLEPNGIHILKEGGGYSEQEAGTEKVDDAEGRSQWLWPFIIGAILLLIVISLVKKSNPRHAPSSDDGGGD